MAPTNPNSLFPRDLKYMVGERHAIVGNTRRNRRKPWPRLLLGIVAISVCGYATSAIWPGGRSDSSMQAKLPVAKQTEIAAPSPSPVSTSASDNNSSEQPGVEPQTTLNRVEPTEETSTQLEEGLTWRRHTVRRGDALSRIFNQHGLGASEALRIAAHPQAKPLGQLRPGQMLEMGVDESGSVQQVRYRINPQQALHIDLTKNAVISETVKVPLDTSVKIAHGNIRRNLFTDGAKAGLNDKLIMKLVAIFGWDIDFALDLRKGDQFTVAYEELYDGDKKIGSSQILAAKFINQGRMLQAFQHVQSNGRVEYYDADGNNLRGTFLRTPMKISRITSGFSNRRFHPVLKKWRAHRGVDYGAPTGTPVLATADGRVSFLGRKGGYGKCIILRHGGKYSTLYAHLSRFRRALRTGSRVRQGQVIGNVGSTGLATGPHLHYEFRVNNQHRNPLTQAIAKAAPIPKKYKADFLATAQTWNERLAQYEKLKVASK